MMSAMLFVRIAIAVVVLGLAGMLWAWLWWRRRSRVLRRMSRAELELRARDWGVELIPGESYAALRARVQRQAIGMLRQPLGRP